MPDYQHPGVYIEDGDTYANEIIGVATSTAAFLGETERGPLTSPPITSYAQYERLFGGPFGEGKYMPHAVAGFFANGGYWVSILRVVGAGATRARRDFGGLALVAASPGAWARQCLWVSVSAPGGSGGIDVRICAWVAPPPGGVFDPSTPRQGRPAPAFEEAFTGLSLDPAAPNFITDVLNGASSLVTAHLAADGQAVVSGAGPLDQDGADAPAPPTSADYIGGEGELRGLAAFDRLDYLDANLLYAPGVCDPADPEALATLRAIIDHCETNRRFAVIDCPAGMSDSSRLDPRALVRDTAFAAAYHPWIRIADPATGEPMFIPPGGHVLGIYARTDVERGVHASPANADVNGAFGLEFAIGDREQDPLTQRGVNAIRAFPGRGVLVWGARTLSSDRDWQYVGVRRLLSFLQASIEQGAQWAVFQPNGEALWAVMRDMIGRFLRDQWVLGAFAGATERDSFFVRCDRTTMTQDDIDSGRLVCEIGFAPLRPAEFMIFRIGQWTADAQA